VWLEQRKREGQREEGGREGTGRSCREDLGFDPVGSGSHGWLWAEEGWT
jgi:hypothetical protein